VVPVIFEHALGNGLHLMFAESPFVDDGGVTGVVEKTGSDPRLRNQSRQTSHLRYHREVERMRTSVWMEVKNKTRSLVYFQQRRISIDRTNP